MNEKQCSKCGEVKLLEQFNNDKKGRLGKQAQCKACRSKQNKEYRLKKGQILLDKKKEYYQKNKERIAEWSKEYNEKNKEKIAERKKKYHLKNKEKIAEKAKAYYEKNKETIKKRAMEYYYADPERHIKRNIEYERERRRRDPSFRLMLNVKGSVYKALVRENGGKYGSRTLNALPFTIPELREHLEKQFDENMTWDNYGSYWHLDHIYPLSLLPYDNLEHPNFLKVWALDNLRPLEAIENIKKSNKIID